MVTTGGGYSDADLERAAENTDSSTDTSSTDIGGGESGDIGGGLDDIPDDIRQGGGGGGGDSGGGGFGGFDPDPAPAPDPEPDPTPDDGGGGGTTDPGDIAEEAAREAGGQPAVEQTREARDGTGGQLTTDGRIDAGLDETSAQLDGLDAEPTPAGGQLTTDGRIDAGLDETRTAIQPGQQERVADAELQRARESFEIDRDPRRIMAGTEQVPLWMDEEDFRVVRDEDGFATEITADARREFEERERDRLRREAAADDPLREPEDFIVEDGSVRRRADPFFEEQREAVSEATGLEVPEAIEEPLTTDRGESRIRRGLQEGREAYSEAAEGEFMPEELLPGVDGRVGDVAAEAAPDVEAAEDIATLGEDIRRGGAEAVNPAGAVLGAATVGEQTADLGQAELETRAEVFSGGAADVTDAYATDVDAPEDFTSELFGVGTPEGSAAAEEREATAAAAVQAGETIAETAQERPGLIAGGAIAGGAVSVGGGLALGRGVRGAAGRIRTAGGTEVDAGDLVNPGTRRLYDQEGGGPGDRFPGFEDPELARQDPAAAVTRQAEEYTPGVLDEAIPGEGPVQFKALADEPEGPGGGRAAQGLRTQEGSYESPGAFVGPELSPNFLRLGGGREFSLRPGLPDTGGRPTAVALRTDVENPDADTLAGFNRELLEREGETTARPKPAQAVNVDEAESVIPGQTEFADVGGGPLRNTLRQAGIGSDFYTEIGGRRVPIRTVAPADEQPGLFGQFLGDERGQVGAGGFDGDRAAFSGSLDELGRGARTPVDRPAPVAGGAPSAPMGSDVFGEIDAAPSVGARQPVDDGREVADPVGSGRPRDGADASERLFGVSESSVAGAASDTTPASSAGESAPSGAGPSSPGGPGSPGESPMPPSSPFGPVSSSYEPFPPSGSYGPPPGGPGATRPTPGPLLPGSDPEPDLPEIEERPYDPETPEYTNPILSGVGDVFGAFDNW